MLFLKGEGIAFNLEVFPKPATGKIFALAHHLVKQGDEQDLSSSSVVDFSVAMCDISQVDLICFVLKNSTVSALNVFSCCYRWRRLFLIRPWSFEDLSLNSIYKQWKM